MGTHCLSKHDLIYFYSREKLQQETENILNQIMKFYTWIHLDNEKTDPAA